MDFLTLLIDNWDSILVVISLLLNAVIGAATVYVNTVTPDDDSDNQKVNKMTAWIRKWGARLGVPLGDK
jgi:hypothetical protein